MQHFDSSKMSDDEYSFIKLYCATVKNDYYLILRLNQLTDPANLGITNVVDAAILAKKLQKMQTEYCNKIEACGTVSKKLAEKYKDEVSHKQIAYVFTQSFFKLIDASTKNALLVDKNTPAHDGWSSGHPSQWQQVIKSLNDVYLQKQAEDAANPQTTIITALINLFSILPKNIKNGKAHYTFYDMEENDWEEYDEYEEDEDDDYFYSQ
jgi:hypothetical protein